MTERQFGNENIIRIAGTLKWPDENHIVTQRILQIDVNDTYLVTIDTVLLDNQLRAFERVASIAVAKRLQVTQEGYVLRIRLFK